MGGCVPRAVSPSTARTPGSNGVYRLRMGAHQGSELGKKWGGDLHKVASFCRKRRLLSPQDAAASTFHNLKTRVKARYSGGPYKNQLNQNDLLVRGRKRLWKDSRLLTLFLCRGFLPEWFQVFAPAALCFERKAYGHCKSQIAIQCYPDFPKGRVDAPDNRRLKQKPSHVCS